MNNITLLYQLPRDKGVKIYDTLPVVEGVEVQDGVLVFLHMDGAYGICEVQDAVGNGIMDSHEHPAVVFLRATTPLRPYKDGYVIDDFDYSDELREEQEETHE